VTPELLRSAGATDGSQWLVVAGWPCQDLSPAGKYRGLEGTRSGALQDLVSVLVGLQHLQPGLPPGYTLENVPLQHNFRSDTLRRRCTETYVTSLESWLRKAGAQAGAQAWRLVQQARACSPLSHLSGVTLTTCSAAHLQQRDMA
jgi:hypothetical protein